MLQPMDDMCIVELEQIYPLVTNEIPQPPLQRGYRIFIPEPRKLFAQKVWKGKVVATGKGYLHEVKHNGISTGVLKRIPMTIKAGDVVLLPAHASNLFKMFDDKTVIIRERDLYGVVTNETQVKNIEIPIQPMYG